MDYDLGDKDEIYYNLLKDKKIVKEFQKRQKEYREREKQLNKVNASFYYDEPLVSKILKKQESSLFDYPQSAGLDGWAYLNNAGTSAVRNDPNLLKEITPKAEDLNKSIRKSKVGLKLLGLASAALAPSADAAAADILIPGGVEELGVPAEQRDLDRRYKERIRQLSERKKR